VSAQPERTCVGCKGKAGKRELVRLVLEANGSVRIDLAMSAPGRGAYVHRDAVCVDRALAHGALTRAMRSRLAPGEAARLRTDLERLMGTV